MKGKRKVNKEERSQRIKLMLLFAFIVFLILAAAILTAAIVVFILLRIGVLAEFTQNDTALSILLMVIISLLLGTGLTLLTSKIPLRPINKIISGMNSLSSGDFKVRLKFGKPIGAHPVFKEIADSFNKMATELENTEMLRSDFINNFSHEFKTPIVSIAGFAKLLKRSDITDAQKMEYINIIEEESLRLSSMATNVLDLAKVENRTILTNISRFNISEQIRSCFLLFENKWVSKNLNIDLEFEEFYVFANEELLKQVWINLIDNAVKFSPEGASVGVKIGDDDGYVSVCVFNTGSTISPEKISKIFNKFYQSDESHASSGNGVGLAVVKKIIDLHKGRIVVDSTDNETSFTVYLLKDDLAAAE